MMEIELKEALRVFDLLAESNVVDISITYSNIGPNGWHDPGYKLKVRANEFPEDVHPNAEHEDSLDIHFKGKTLGGVMDEFMIWYYQAEGAKWIQEQATIGLKQGAEEIEFLKKWLKEHGEDELE